MARRFVLWALATALSGTITAVAPSGAAAQQRSAPTELPPSGFQGKQFVDSSGCVFVRAGVDGNVTWVPRVTRQRKQICGARPTFAQAAPAPEPAPRPQPQVVQITPDPDPVAPRAQVAQPQPKPTARRQPLATVASKPARRAPATVAAPRRVIAAPQKPAAAPLPQQRAAAPAPRKGVPARRAATGSRHKTLEAACAGGAKMVMRKGSDGTMQPILCDTRTRRSVTSSGQGAQLYRNSVGEASVRAVPGGTRIVPRHVYEARNGATPTPPKGYRRAFDDDRLNPRRAEQSVAGYLATQLVWTNTVPRRLIDRASGRDVTRKYPKLVYPYTDLATQTATLSTKNRAPQVKAKPRKTVARAVAPKKVQRAAKGRYVQVGTYGVEANARRAAGKLKALGLPVRFGEYRKGGKTLRTVLAGPFSDAGHIQRALRAARGAGYRDAFIR